MVDLDGAQSQPADQLPAAVRQYGKRLQAAVDADVAAHDEIRLEPHERLEVFVVGRDGQPDVIAVRIA